MIALIDKYFPDLTQPYFTSGLAVVHSARSAGNSKRCTHCTPTGTPRST